MSNSLSSPSPFVHPGTLILCLGFGIFCFWATLRFASTVEVPV